MVKALLFDVDGVVVNAKRFSQVLEEDYEISPKETLPFFRGKFLECLVGKADLKAELIPHLKQGGWDKSLEDFYKKMKNYLE